MRKVTPFLWFDTRAEEAAKFYVSIFRDSKMGNIVRSGTDVLTVQFWLYDQEFTALNGGPYYNFTPAVSFVVNCNDQAEIDYYWEKLSEGGSDQQCGWLTDKFGLSWQVVPSVLPKFLSTDDPRRAKRVMDVLLKMKKLEIQPLQDAYENK